MKNQSEYQPTEQEAALLEYVKANAGKDGHCNHSIKRMVKGLGLASPRDFVKMTSTLYLNDLLDIDISTGDLKVIEKYFLQSSTEFVSLPYSNESSRIGNPVKQMPWDNRKE